MCLHKILVCFPKFVESSKFVSSLYLHISLRQRVNVFMRVCWFVCLSVNEINKNLWMNVCEILTGVNRVIYFNLQYVK